MLYTGAVPVNDIMAVRIKQVFDVDNSVGSELTTYIMESADAGCNNMGTSIAIKRIQNDKKPKWCDAEE